MSRNPHSAPGTVHKLPHCESDASSSGRPGSSLRRESLDGPGGGALHHGFLSTGGTPGLGPQLAAPDSALSLEDRLLRGQDESSILSSETGKDRALNILGRTEEGRRRAEEIFGSDVWDKNRGGVFGRRTSVEQSQDDDKNVDMMFNDLINGDDDDRRERDRVVTADSLEAERNAMDMEDSD